jgi:DNA-binding GntR family transcriptional regulator
MIEFTTKSEAVRLKLRQRIIERELKPGQKIVISEIAKEFGISEIPVREAIKKLESEGLVKFTPHVGAMVNAIAGDEFLEIYLMRIELEALATKLSAEHMKVEDIAELKGFVEKAEQAIEEGRIDLLGSLNKSFHLKIYRTAPYPFLFKTIVDLWEKFELMKCVFAYVPERAVPSWGEHKIIVEALEQRDAERAAKLVRQQKNRTKRALEKILSSKQ